MNVPIVQHSDLLSADPAALRRAADAVRRGFSELGLVYVQGAPLALTEVHALYDEFLGVLDRPASEKTRWGGAGIWYQRGWTPPNTEVSVQGGGQPDFKECFFAAPVPSSRALRLEYPQIHAENIWPPSAGEFSGETFKQRYLEVGAALHEMGMLLLRGCALALDLPEETFERLTQLGPHVTRILHYLPLKPEQVNSGILWGEEHTDFNLLTLLPGGRFYDAAGKACARPDDKSGLYLRTRGTAENPAGELVRGAAPEGCFVAQVGQQLEILTGGTYLATPHVVTAPGVPGYSRMSSAHFIHMGSNEVLFPLEKFHTDQVVESYGPRVLAGTYGIKTLVDIGLAPPSALERLGYRHYDRLGSIRAQNLGA